MSAMQRLLTFAKHNELLRPLEKRSLAAPVQLRDLLIAKFRKTFVGDSQFLTVALNSTAELTFKSLDQFR